VGDDITEDLKRIKEMCEEIGFISAAEEIQKVIDKI